MAIKDELAVWQNHYHLAWQEIKGEITNLLEDDGFTLHGSDIGNVHGEVYANADDSTLEATSLYQVRLSPTRTGKL